MSDFNNSANMDLPIPTVGIAPGPDWATLLNSCLTILDAHSHTPGSGVPITPAALNLNTDVSLLGNSLTVVKSIQFSAQASLAATSALYEIGADLYYRDGNGTQIRITQSGSVAGSAGTITGLPSGTASAAYAAGTFTWQSATATAANMDFGSAILRNTSPNSTYSLTLSPPPAMGANTAITLPATPASTAPLVMDSSGVITAPVALYAAFCPPGAVIPFAGSAAPTGWLFCQGAAVSRTTYATLFAVIGTTFGVGDGSTTFNIPDMRGNVPAYPGGSIGSLGTAGGEAAHTLTTPEIPGHSHTITDPGHFHNIETLDTPPNGTRVGGAAGSAIPDVPTRAAFTGITGTNSSGGGGAHNNIQPYLSLYFIIKT